MRPARLWLLFGVLLFGSIIFSFQYQIPWSFLLGHSHSAHRITLKPFVEKRIHQSWKTHQLPPRFELWSKTWKTCFPDWKYTLWSDQENLEFIQKEYPWMLQFYTSLPREIYRADAMRYVYLYHFGGVYADLDAPCLRPFDHLLENYTVVFGAMAGQDGPYLPEGTVENSFMYSRAKHPFWMHVFEDMMNRTSGEPGIRTGPLMLEDNIIRHRSKYEREWRIYPPFYFNPFSYMNGPAESISNCKVRNKMNETEMEACRQYYYNRGSYVLQYHTTTWKDGKTLRRRRRR